MAAADFLARPKAELHVHLRGAAPAEFLGALLRKYPPEKALAGAPARHLRLFAAHAGIRAAMAGRYEQNAFFRYDSFDGFLAAYLFSSYFVRGIEDFRGMIAAVRRQFARQNIVYAEVTVSVIEYVNQGIPLEALLEALAEEPATPPRVRWIVDLVRNIGPEAAERLLDRILERRPRNLTAITLGGAEHLFPPAPFARVFDKARGAGLKLTVHAGEALGPESVRDAVRALKVDRIGHGVRAVEDPALVERIAARRIPLEVCPTSNVRTGIYRSYDEHPARRLFEAGAPLTVNTDDPTFFGVTLAQELAALTTLGFSPDEIGGIAENGFRFAFDPAAAAGAKAAAGQSAAGRTTERCGTARPEDRPC